MAHTPPFLHRRLRLRVLGWEGSFPASFPSLGKATQCPQRSWPNQANQVLSSMPGPSQTPVTQSPAGSGRGASELGGPHQGVGTGSCSHGYLGPLDSPGPASGAWFRYLRLVWLASSGLTVLCLSFPICKVRTPHSPAAGVYREVQASEVGRTGEGD